MPDDFIVTFTTFFSLFSETILSFYAIFLNIKNSFTVLKSVYVKVYVPSLRYYDMELNLIRLNKDIRNRLHRMITTPEFAKSKSYF